MPLGTTNFMLSKFINTMWSHFTLENVQRLITVLGGRRFLLTLGAGLVTSILVWHGKISPEIYRDVILGTVGIYIAGNTFQKNQEVKAKSNS